MSWLTVRVPASSANLGPGFDALGMALGVYLVCRFRQSAELRITATGRDVESIPTGADNMIWQTAATVGCNHGLEMPFIELDIQNDIPIGKGLGSSAAALTAGVVIADHVLNLGWKPLRMLDEAARLEGHADNVAACTLGSIVASAIDLNGVARAVRLELPRRFGVGVVVPDFDLPTPKARAVLPASYSREDAVFNVQRASLLIAALAAGATWAFPAALDDRLHQPYRAPLVPGLDETLKLRAPGLLGCVLSGAGPSILVFYERGHECVCELVRQVFARHGHQSDTLHASIADRGFEVTAE